MGGLLEMGNLGFDAINVHFSEPLGKVEPFAYRLDPINSTAERLNPRGDLTAPVLPALWAFTLQGFEITFDTEPCGGVGIKRHPIKRRDTETTEAITDTVPKARLILRDYETHVAQLIIRNNPLG